MAKELRSFTIGNLEIWENGEVFKIKDGTKTKYEPTKFNSRSKKRLMASYYEDGKQKHIYLSREIALRFLPNPESKPYVSFKDGDPTNVSIENLVWISEEERAEQAALSRKDSQIICEVCGRAYAGNKKTCTHCSFENKRKENIRKNKEKKIERLKEKYKHVDKEKLPEKWLSILNERLSGETLEEIGDKRGFTHEYIRQVLVSIENGGVNKQRVKSSKKAKERIEWLEERIKKYQIEKEFLEEKVLKEVEK